MSGIIGLMFLPVFLLFAVALSLAMLAFWIWMLVHAIQNKGLDDTERVVWVLVIALVHFIGAVIYFFVGKPKANTPLQRPTVASSA